MKIVVLAGGLSPERDVSLTSGSLIANALIENGHQVLLLDLYIGLASDHWSDQIFLTREQPERYHYSIPAIEPDLEGLKKSCGHGSSLIGPHVVEICQTADLVFLALHGSEGENGKIQALFDLHGIKYTGSGYAGSLLAMDKDLAKRLLSFGGVQTAPWTLVQRDSGQWLSEAKTIGFPCVVKPCSSGSSVGVSIVHNETDLAQAIQSAGQYESEIVIEKMIRGREFSIGILDHKALPVIEIIPKTSFYDYQNKYQAGLTIEVCPADLAAELTEKLQVAALRAHVILRLGFYSRIDFLMDEANEIYCLEANTLPGMTPTSLLPQEAAAVQISYPELCERIARSAL